MAIAEVGFFGKLPSHGDFIERRVRSAFREAWDTWLQRCIADSQRQLGSHWLDCYLTSPLWRFFLCDGIAGAASYAGVLLPSVDRVGRYFPLTVVVELPAELAALSFAEAAADWFNEVEQLCAGALENPSFELLEFDQALGATSRWLSGLDQLSLPRPFPGGSTQWRWPLRAVDNLGAALGGPLMITAQTALRPMSLWWTAGSELVHPSVLVVRSLPKSESFADLLAGTWEGGRWDGEMASPEPEGAGEAEAMPDYSIRSAGASDPGTVRQENQDHHLLQDELRLWAVADGMGGHSQGEVASRMVVDALNSIEPTASLNTALESVSVALSRVNNDLRRAALGVGRDELTGSTVVVLAIRGLEWGVFWAGDSRAYVHRSGSLTQLTRDHTVATEAAGEPSGSLADLVVGGDEITRAVGGDTVLELDYTSGLIADRDRFLLCSDGLYSALGEARMAHCLQQGTPEEATRTLVEAARSAGALDNVTAVIVEVASAFP
jgi:type VI secretion system ImpM family protein